MLLLLLPSQSFGISYGSHYGMNSAIKQGHLSLLCLYETTVVFLCLHFFLCASSPPGLSCLLLVVNGLTSIKNRPTSSLLFFFPILLGCFLHFSHRVEVRLLSPDVTGLVGHSLSCFASCLVCICFYFFFVNGRGEETNYNPKVFLLLNPSVGPSR